MNVTINADVHIGLWRSYTMSYAYLRSFSQSVWTFFFLQQSWLDTVEYACSNWRQKFIQRTIETNAMKFEEDVWHILLQYICRQSSCIAKRSCSGNTAEAHESPCKHILFF